MLKRLINELEIGLELRSVSPLLVKDGRSGNIGVPISRISDAELQSALHSRVPEAEATMASFPFYLPGSSLRGAWRSSLERTLRSLERPNRPQICNPFEATAGHPEQSCSKLLEAHDEFYARSCPVCRMFGSTVQAGRFQIGDGELTGEVAPRVFVRDQVAISRASGAAADKLKFQSFVLEGGRFTVNLRLRNFELRQICMLGMIVESISRVPVGSGKGKGFGWLETQYKQGSLTYFGNRPADNRVRGIGEDPVWGEEIRRNYGIVQRAALPSLGPPELEHWNELSPWRYSRGVTAPDFDSLWRAIDLDWNSVPLLAERLN